MAWRVGKKVPINVYDGDRPVCQCQTAVDAKRIVDAVNDHVVLKAKVSVAHTILEKLMPPKGVPDEWQRKAAAYDRLMVWVQNRENIGSGPAREIRDILEATDAA